ncbi:MAG: MmcQ/YjbR family DNA-binding protein [Solirubrobacteraceae bacterium]
MSSWDDVRRLALSLPETSEQDMHGLMSWRVKDKLFVWERPLRQSDLNALAVRGDDAPTGEIVGARVEHEGAKLALIESDPEVYFTIPHFDGYSAILALLERIGLEELEELITEAWLLRAPKRVAAAYLAARED